MALLTVRDLPDEIHRALRARAARRGHSVETEVRDILAAAVRPKERVKLGSLLADIGRQARLSEQEFAVFQQMRDKTPAIKRPQNPAAASAAPRPPHQSRRPPPAPGR